MRALTALTSSPLWIHATGTVVAFGVFQAVRIQLDKLYAASGHPVDFATGQTTFDAERIKGFYATMSEGGTLDVYVQTQQFDYLFMVCLALFGTVLGTLLARLAHDGSWARTLGFTAALAAITGAVFDALENAVSFVMLANPQGFADWLALPYSGCAVIKFGFITLALFAALGAILLIAAGRLVRRPRLG